MNLVQCEGSLDENKRKRKRSDDEFDYVYGVVTTGTRWWYTIFTSERGIYTTTNLDSHFLPLSRKAVKDDAALRQSVKKIVSTIAWMLQDRAGVGEDASAKRRRVEENTREAE
jgi:hypothetical protein